MIPLGAHTLVFVAGVTGCGERPELSARDAGREAGDASEVVDASDGVPDAGGDLTGRLDVSGGCIETRTVLEQERADDVTGALVSAAPGGFALLLEVNIDLCLQRLRGFDGTLQSEIEVPVELCNGEQLVVVDEDHVMVLDGPGSVWIGDLNGDWGPVDVDWPASWRPVGMGVAPMGTTEIFLSDSTGILRLDWAGQVQALVETPYIAEVDATTGIVWSGTTLLANWDHRRPEDDPGISTAYVQRFDGNLVPLDAEPVRVTDLDGALEQHLMGSTTGWLGTEFVVAVSWSEGFGDFVQPNNLDLFRFTEVGEPQGSFQVLRGADDDYQLQTLRRVFPVPGRVVFLDFAQFYDADEGWNWEGEHGAAFAQTSGERVGEDARLGSFQPTVRSRNRLARLRRLAPEGGGPDLEVFTVLDCTGLFGELAE